MALIVLEIAGWPHAALLAPAAPPLLAAAAILLGMRLHRPASAPVWWLVLASVLLFGATASVFGADPALGARHPELGGLLELLALGGFVALFGAAVAASRAMHAGASWAEVADTALVLLAAGTVMWQLVLVPLERVSGVAGVAAFAMGAVPAGGLLVAAVLLRLTLATAEPLAALRMLAGAAKLYVAGYLGLAIAARIGGPAAAQHLQPLFAAGWTAAAVLAGLAALDPSMRRLCEPCRRHPDVLGRRLSLVFGAALLVPPLSTAAAVRLFGQPFLARALVLPAVAITALVLLRMRQLFVSRERMQAELVLRERRFRRLVENQRDHVLLLCDGAVAYQSPSLSRLLGFPPERIAAEGLGALLPAEEVPVLEALAAEARAAAGTPVGGVLQGRTAAGALRRFEATATDLAADRAVGGLVLVLHDVTEREGFEAELQRRALHDPLTGLANRTLVIDRAQQMLAAARRDWRPVAALFIDLDNFKLINDSLGHQAGDDVLRAVAERLQRAVREADTVGRLGGDEFVVLLGQPGAEGHAPEMVAERIRDVLRAPFELAGRPYTVQASIGIAVRAAGTAQDLLRDADVSMYRAKSAGKNRVVVFQPQMQVMAQARLELEADLRAALQGGGGLTLAYQPAVDLRDLRVTGLEALVRWTHPWRGPIPPSEFVPLAEEVGLIGELGRFVLREACRTAAAWQADHPGLAVSVNVSGRQVEAEELVGDVRAALAQSGLPPACLVLELTESALMHEPAAAARCIRSLKAVGVRVAIDDFGTGYSSLSYLRQFPVDVLKIDRSFIRDLQDSAEAAAVVQTLVQLGKALNLEVIAEGVELEPQLAALRRQDCDTGQGFLFARPLDGETLRRFLREWTLGQPQPGPAPSPGAAVS